MKIIKVKCIDNDNGRLSLTIGKLYDFYEFQDFGDWVCVINDNGRLMEYKKFRFEEIL